MSSAERDRDRDRNGQEGETAQRPGAAARSSPVGKLRSELGATFSSSNSRSSVGHDNKQNQRAGKLRQVRRRAANRTVSDRLETAHATRAGSSNSRSHRENVRRNDNRNRQRWSSSPYRRDESPKANDAISQHSASRLRNETIPFTRPTRHDVATRLLNRTRNTNRTRNGDTTQVNAKLPNRNRKRKRLFSESAVAHTDGANIENNAPRSAVRKNNGRFAKRRRFAVRRGAAVANRISDADRYRSQSAQRGDTTGNATRLQNRFLRFSPHGFGGVWRSPAGTAILLERPRISPPANSNEYLINEHNQIDGVSPIVYKATSTHSTATTPFGGTYTFPYTTAYRPDDTEESSTAIAHHFSASNSKLRDDEAEVSTSFVHGFDEPHEDAEVTDKHDEAIPAGLAATSSDSNRQQSSAAANTRAASRRRAQATNAAVTAGSANAQYDAEFSELYVRTLLDRFQQMNKQELVTQCLSLSGEVELLEARLRDLKKQNDRLVRTGNSVTAAPSNVSVSSAVSSSVLQVSVSSGGLPVIQSQCSVSSSNVQSDLHTDDSAAAIRNDENELSGHELHSSVTAAASEHLESCN